LGIRPDRGMIAAGAFDKMVYLIDTRSWRVMSVSSKADRNTLPRYACSQNKARGRFQRRLDASIRAPVKRVVSACPG